MTLTWKKRFKCTIMLHVLFYCRLFKWLIWSVQSYCHCLLHLQRSYKHNLCVQRTIQTTWLKRDEGLTPAGGGDVGWQEMIRTSPTSGIIEGGVFWGGHCVRLEDCGIFSSCQDLAKRHIRTRQTSGLLVFYNMQSWLGTIDTRLAMILKGIWVLSSTYLGESRTGSKIPLLNMTCECHHNQFQNVGISCVSLGHSTRCSVCFCVLLISLVSN